MSLETLICPRRVVLAALWSLSDEAEGTEHVPCFRVLSKKSKAKTPENPSSQTAQISIPLQSKSIRTASL